MKLEKLTRKIIQQRCDAQVYERGEDYYRSGRVRQRMKSTRGIKVQVHGTQVYAVAITERRGEMVAICTCPYGQSWEGYCKHIVAVLLAWLEEPESFAAVKDFPEMLQKKTKEELVEMLSQIGETYPAIAQDFLGAGGREFDPGAAMREALEAFESSGESTRAELVRRIEPIAQRAEAALVRGDTEMARRTYYELVLRCLQSEEKYGSTEIFPDGLVYSYAQGYHEAVEADPEREQKAAMILEEIAEMEGIEVAEIEGIEFGELRKLLAAAKREKS